MKQLRNYTEEAVKQYLDKWYSSTDSCQCEGCRLDVMAIMLNNLAPKYVVTDTGEMYAQMGDFDPQYRTDYMVEMTHAINVIKDRPRHDVRPLPKP